MDACTSPWINATTKNDSGGWGRGSDTREGQGGHEEQGTGPTACFDDQGASEETYHYHPLPARAATRGMHLITPSSTRGSKIAKIDARRGLSEHDLSKFGDL